MVIMASDFVSSDVRSLGLPDGLHTNEALHALGL